MRRKFLSVVLCVCMMLTMAPFAFAAENDTPSIDIGGGSGSSATPTSNPITTADALKNAINNAEDGSTITISGTIEISEPLVVTKTITLTGGTIKASDTFNPNSDQLSVANLISLKTDDKVLTLKDITLNGNQKTLVVFCNKGKVIIDNATITNGKSGSFVAGVYMTAKSQFEMNSGSITGNEVGDSYKNDNYTQYAADLWIGANADGALTAINGGTIGNVFVNSNEWSANNPGGFTMSGGHVTNLYVEYESGSKKDGTPYAYGASFTYNGGTIDNLYISTTNGNGDCKKVTPVVGKAYVGGQTDEDTLAGVARIGDTTYATLSAAVAAAKPNEATTITLLDNIVLPEYIYIKNEKDITLNLNGKNITHTGYGVFYVGNAKFHVMGKGVICENQRDGFAPIIAKGSPIDTENYTVITIDKDVTLKGDYAGIFVDTDTNGKDSYYNYGLVINMNGFIDLTTIDDGVSAYGIYVQGLNKITTGNIMQINLDGARITTGEEAIYAAGYAKWNLKNCTFNTHNAAIEIRAGEMTIDGGTYIATAPTFKCEANGNGSTTEGAALAIMQHTTKLPISVTVKNGTFKAAAAVAEKNVQKNNPDPNVNLKIEGGQFNGSIVSDDASSFITGGYFTTDPSAYCVENKTGIPSTEPGYAFTVGEKATDVKPATAAPAVDASSISDNTDKATATTIGQSVQDTTGVLSAAANEAAKEISNSQVEAATHQFKEELPSTGTGEQTVFTYAQTYLKVTPTAVTKNGESITSITLDIQPMSRVVASTVNLSADMGAQLITEGNDKNAVVLKNSETELHNIKTMVISFELPSNFVTKKDDGTYPAVYVQHKGHEYTATVTKDATSNKLIATFTNPDGFSPFTISTESTAVAKIGKNSYTSLEDAINAVKDNDTITLLKDTNENITVSKAVKFTLANKEHLKGTISAGSRYSMTTADVEGNTKYTFTYVGGGSSSSGTPTTSYNVNVNAATNGAVAADKKTASKGTTVTVTASPSKGYVVDAVKVVDKDGKDVAVTEKDGKYVFTMPASAVTVTGSFKAETPAPVALPFTDVKSGNWFYDAVKYAYEQGLMTGTSATTFAPNGTMNRAMIVTVLYRLEKSPAVTGASKFTDVPAGQWYSDAVAWAAANKIVNGYDETTFGPMNAVTREQMAAILFRYEQVKGLENVTLEENLNRFPDQNKISAYAIPALQWAVGQKIINGNADGTLDPTGTATRAQVAQIFTNLLNK